jgi:hypothetical protein
MVERGSGKAGGQTNMSRQTEYANRAQVETRDLAKYMMARGCPRKLAIKTQAAEELRSELPSNVDSDMFQKLLEQRCAILGGN